MKTIRLLLVFFVCIACSNAQNISENFDSYLVRGSLASQSEGLWSTWTNTPGSNEDAPISNDFSFSGENSAKFEAGGAVDVVLPLGDQTFGRWNLSFMMYIPSTKGAYFNVLHAFDGQASNWAFDVFFSESGSGSLALGGANSTNTQNFNFTHDLWFQVTMILDVDSETASATIDGAEMNWDWTIGSSGASSNIGALNLYAFAPEGESGLYYVDDVAFKLTNLSLEENNSAINLFPNPTSSDINIEGVGIQGFRYEVLSLLGRTMTSGVLVSKIETIDCAVWAPGVYFVRLTNSRGLISTRKILIK